MSFTASRFERALRAAGIPIIGVSCGSDDRSTWTIQFADAATAQHRADAETLRQSFDPSAQASIDAEISARAAASAADKDRLADIALMIRYKDITAWNALSLAQKAAAVRAQQTVWEGIRDFIEKNL
jgi:hypothetical protein